jgi:hypothetical protein
LEKRVTIIEPFHLVHALADTFQFCDYVFAGVYALNLDTLAFDGERTARRLPPAQE